MSSFQEVVITQLMHFLPGRSVRGKALDEEGHGDDEADAHEEDTVPVGLQKDKGYVDNSLMNSQQVFRLMKGGTSP